MLKKKRKPINNEFNRIYKNDQNGDVLSNIFSYFTIDEAKSIRLVTIFFKYVIESLTPLKYNFSGWTFPPLTRHNCSHIKIHRKRQLESLYEHSSKFTFLKNLKISIVLRFSSLFGIIQFKHITTLYLNCKKIKSFNWLLNYIKESKVINLGFYELQLSAFDFDESLTSLKELFCCKKFEKISLKKCQLSKNGIELFKILKCTKFKLSNTVQSNTKGKLLVDNLYKNVFIKTIIFKKSIFDTAMIINLIKKFKSKPKSFINLKEIRVRDYDNQYDLLLRRNGCKMINELQKYPRNVFISLKNDKNIVSFNKAVQLLF